MAKSSPMLNGKKFSQRPLTDSLTFLWIPWIPNMSFFPTLLITLPAKNRRHLTTKTESQKIHVSPEKDKKWSDISKHFSQNTDLIALFHFSEICTNEVFYIIFSQKIKYQKEKCGLFPDFEHGFRSSRSTADLLTANLMELLGLLTGLGLLEQ